MTILLVPQRHQRIHFRRASRRDVTGNQSDHEKTNRYCRKDARVGGGNFEQQTGDQTGQYQTTQSSPTATPT